MTKIASVFILLILFVSIGFGIYLSQQNQSLKSRANATPSIQAYCQGVHDNLRIRINWSGLPALQADQYYDIRTYDNSGDADAGQDSRNGRNTTLNSEGSTFVTVSNQPNNSQLVAAHRRPYQVLITRLGSGGSNVPIADSGVFSCKADPSDVRIDELSGGGDSCGVISGQARIKLNAFTDFSLFANNQIHLWLMKGGCGLGNNSSCNPQGYNSNLSEDTMVKIISTDNFGRFSYDLKNDPTVAHLFANNANRTIALYGVGVADAEFWNNFYYTQINVSGCSATTTPIADEPPTISTCAGATISCAQGYRSAPHPDPSPPNRCLTCVPIETPNIDVTQNNGQVTVTWTGQANGVWITDQAVANIGNNPLWCGSCRNILTTRQTDAADAPNLAGNSFSFGSDLAGFRVEGTSRTDIGKYNLVNGKKYWIMVSNGSLLSSNVEFTYQAPVTTPPVGEPNPNPSPDPNPPTNPPPPAPVNTKATGSAQVQGCLLSGNITDSNYVNNETGKLIADLWVSGSYYVKDSSNKCVASNSLYLGYAEAKSIANSSGNYSFDFSNTATYAAVTSSSGQNGVTYKNSTCTEVAYPNQEIIKKSPKDVSVYFIDLGADGKRVPDSASPAHNSQVVQISCDPDKDVKPLFVRFSENEDDLKQFSQNKCNLDINQVVTNKVAPEAYIANGCPPLNDISTGIAKISEYKFKNQSAGLKTIYAEFIYSNGKTVQKKSSIEAVAPDPKITNLTCGKDLTGRGLSLTIKGNNFLAKNTQSQIKINNATANITNWSNPNGGVQTVTATYEDSKLTPEQGQQYNITLIRADGRTDTASCLVGVSQLSLGAKVWCRQPSKYDQDNVEVVIAEAITGGKRIETKVKIDKDGNLQGINNQLKAGACYRMSIKAPKSVRRVVEFQAQEGSTIIPDFRLPIGDIYPDGGGDGKINASDRSEIIRQWSAIRSSSNSGSLVKTGDLNIDSVINSFDFSCMMYDYNEGDAPKVEAGPIDGSKNPALKQSCDESFNQNNYSTNNATGSATVN